MRTNGISSVSVPPMFKPSPPVIPTLVSMEGAAIRLAAMVSVPARLIEAFEICGTTGAACGFSSLGLSRLMVATSVSRRSRVNSIFAACWNPWLSKCTLISAHRNENIPAVSRKPRTSAIGKRIDATAASSSSRRRGRADGDVADPAEVDLVHHLGDDADVSRLVGDDHRGVLGPLDVHAFHQRAHVAQVHLPAVNPAVAVLVH